MKRILYLCCLIGLAACNNNKPKSAETYSATPTGLQGIQQSAASTPASASGQSSATAGALNPAHGAPGHRCDIAVGAPLNSSPATTQASAPIQQQVVPQAVTPAPVTATTSGQKLNPKHGDPGHRCDIAVGAPLDSKPTQTATTAAPAVTTTSSATPKATTAAAVPMFNEKGQRLNPEHGKPGHKCEIAVGAPLT